MASGIQRDTVSWLNSKLESPWTSERVVAHLSNPMLQSFAEKFSSLDTGIKLRILFSFLSLRKKNLEDMREGIHGIIDIAKTDEDEWVKVCAQLLSSINEQKQKVAIDSLENNEIHSTIEQLKSSLTTTGPIQYCPLEYAYLSSKVLPTLPTSVTNNSHFHVRQKMTITIKKDSNLPQKKKTDDIDSETMLETPSPSIAPRNKGPPSSGLGMKKGIQMQRKKMQVIDIREVEELNKKQEEEKEAKKKKAAAEEKLDTVKVGVPVADPEKKRKKKEEDLLKPKAPKKETPKKLKSGEPLPITPTVQPAMVGATMSSPTAAARPIIVSTGSPQVPTQQLGINPISPYKAPTTPAPVADTSASSLLSQALGQSAQGPKLVHSVYSPMTPPMKPTTLSPMVAPQATTPNMLKPNPTPPIRTPSPAPPPTTPTAPATPTQPGQTIVTPDSLLENANSLSTEDRQVVLRFLMGDRTNPNPAQGNIHQILLNFETKVNPQNGGLYQEQLIFEMNYETGTWRKLRRKKALQKEEGSAAPTPTVQ